MQNWEYKKLEETCEFLDSKRKPITANKRVPGPYPYYGATGILDYVEDYLFDEELILLGEDGAKWDAGDNSAFLISGKTWVNNHAHVLRPNNNVFNNWIIYFLNYSNLMIYVKGATVPKLNQENARSIEIPLPPLEEQKRIVKILDEKFAQLETVKANAKANLQNAKDLFQSQLTKAFSNTTWEKKRLDEICLIRPSKADTTRNLKDSDEVSFLPMEDLQVMNYYIEPKQSKILKEVSGSYTCFANGDVLLAKVTPCFENGKQGIAKDLDNGVGFGSSEYIVFRPLEKVISEYIYYSLATPEFKEGGKKNLLGACGLKRLSKDYVNAYEIPLPPLSEQKRIVEQLDSLSEKVRSLEEIYTKQLANCDELKQAFLAKAFNGEL